jgi:hypothetical protein
MVLFKLKVQSSKLKRSSNLKLQLGFAATGVAPVEAWSELGPGPWNLF